MPKISVIVPVYKVEQYLDRCVESILAQTFTDFELILVDDGSPDNCPQMCDNWAKKDGRIKVIHKPNGGVSSARNMGLDYAQGEYVMFCDSDDYVEPYWCAELLQFIEKYPNSWCFCGCHCVDANDTVFEANCVFDSENTYQTLPISEYWEIYKTNYSALLWIRIFETSIIRENHIRFDENMSVSEDVLFNLEYGKHCDQFAIVNLPLYNHRSYLNNEAEHLDGKLPPECFYMNKRIYNARTSFITQPHRVKFETDTFYNFINDIRKIAKETSLSETSKRKKIKAILNSREFSSSIKNADTSKENWKLLLLLKLKLSKLVLNLFSRG